MTSIKGTLLIIITQNFEARHKNWIHLHCHDHHDHHDDDQVAEVEVVAEPGVVGSAPFTLQVNFMSLFKKRNIFDQIIGVEDIGIPHCRQLLLNTFNTF